MKKDKRPEGSRHGGVLAIITILNAALIIGLLLHRGDGAAWGLILPTVGRDSAGGSDRGNGSGDGAMGPVVKLPNVLVKLQTADSDLYVDAAFDLEVATEHDRDAVHQRLSRIREATIGILSALTPADVRGSLEIEKTKQRLLQRFRDVVPGHELRALYVNNLIVD